MPRLIFKCPYLAPGAACDRGGYVTYIATRDGVEVIPPEKRGAPATKKQHELIQKILRDFPDAKDSFEYDDYLSNPTVGNASEFITRALEDNIAQGREGYVSYISERPNVAVVGGGHGLFGSGKEPLILSRVADAVWDHPGNVWTPILSLRREDAARLGYDNAAGWKDLLTAHAATLARWFKIPPEDFVWYAAFHNEGRHPHAHMICYSRNPAQGFLTVDGIRGIKSELTRDIFRHDLEEIYRQQTLYRADVGQAAQDTLRAALHQMDSGTLADATITQKMEDLAGRLRFHGGKLVYGYLRPPVKAIVDSIVDELEKDPRVAQAYAKWLEARREIVQGYTSAPETETPLSRRKEFKQIRNMVVDEAARLLRGAFTLEQTLTMEEVMDDEGDAWGVEPEDNSMPEPPTPMTDGTDTDIDIPSNDADDILGGDGPGEEPPPDASMPAAGALPYVEWTDAYKTALGFLYGTKTLPPNFEDAYTALLTEAEKGNALAMHDLGRMFEKGLGRDIDREAARGWYEKALAAFLAVEKESPGKYVAYRIGKMYNAGLGTQQNHTQAADWFQQSAQMGYKYAQYSLGCLCRDGKGVERDPGKALRLFESSSAQEFPYASFELGKMLRDGTVMEKDPDGADAAFQKAFDGFLDLESERPDDNLQYRIGWMLLTGTGVEKDTGRAEAYFKRPRGKTMSMPNTSWPSSCWSGVRPTRPLSTPRWAGCSRPRRPGSTRPNTPWGNSTWKIRDSKTPRRPSTG